MFKNNNRKQKPTNKEVVKMKNILIGMIFVVVAFCATSAWAAQAQTVTVNATIPTITNGLSVTVSKITGTVWTAASTISFGTLIWDTVNHIFLPASYFAIDIGVTDNSNTAWTVTHTRASLAKGTDNLNNKVNVSFVKQTSDTTDVPLQKVSFGNSQSIAYTKAQLTGGWLRIYYGVGTGEAGKDADGVTPIGLDTPAGTYTGSVTITLTP
ncbi:MAG: hypothetical protein V1830_00170 [Candidatus Omnitrophota bacterium]